MTTKLTFGQVMAAMFGDCIDHQHQEIGRCVYCSECGRRLYQGSVMTPEQLAAIKEAARLADEEKPQ